MVNKWLTKVELDKVKSQIGIDGMKGSSEDKEEHEESSQGEENCNNRN